MNIDVASEYYACISILSAREDIAKNSVSSWPHLKKEDRAKNHNKLLKQADLIDNRLRAATVQDIARIIGK